MKAPIRVRASHPSNVLPVQARIDYRRLCEVEHNVCCKDVGLVDVDSTARLLEQLEPCRAKKHEGCGTIGVNDGSGSGTTDDDDGDLDIGIE